MKKAIIAFLLMSGWVTCAEGLPGDDAIGPAAGDQQAVTMAAGGNKNKQVKITPVDDALVEGPESVVLTLSPDPAYSIDVDRSVVAFDIVDSEPVPPVDGDGDGMADAWEIDHFGGTNEVNGGALEDWDGDEVINLHESMAGTDPTNRDSLLQITEVTAGASATELVVRWPAVAGNIYGVLYKTSITDPSWMLYEVDIPGVTPECVHTVDLEHASSYLSILLQ